MRAVRQRFPFQRTAMSALHPHEGTRADELRKRLGIVAELRPIMPRHPNILGAFGEAADAAVLAIAGCSG